MAVPTDLLWPRDRHTEAKHRILRGYLDAWWPILLLSFPQATYAEGYAGPGEYKGGEDGSPVVALRSLLERDDIDLSGRQVNIVLVEERDDRLSHCLEQIRQHVGELPPRVQLHAQPGSCEEQLVPALRAVNAFGMPILANLDPFGAGVPYDVVCELAANQSSEVLISFMAQWFIRFADFEELAEGDRQFGNADWRAVAKIPSEQKRRWLIDRYRQRLRDAGFQHTVWLELVDEGGRAFWLIFATNSPRGLEKMKESFWKVDPVRGIHFRDPRDPGQLSFDVGEDPYLTPLRNLLLPQLDGQRDVPVEELRDWTLEQTVFLPTHAMTVLQDLRGAGRLEVDLSGKLQRRARVTLRDAPDVTTKPEPQQPGLFNL